MKNDKTISANEINRYLYCNYQWYYERKHGAAELRRQKSEYLQEMGIMPNKASPIQRGLAFHAKFGRRRRLKLAWVWFRAAAILALVLYFLWTFGIVVL